VNDYVLVDRSNHLVKVRNKTLLMRKWLGSYRVIKAIVSQAYILEVQQGIPRQNFAHSIVLKPFRRQNWPSNLDEDKEEVYQVDKIVNSRRLKGLVQYRVRWTGCVEFEDT